jgi:nitrogen regulatory protein P-II 1
VLASSAGGASEQAAAEAKEPRDPSGRGAFSWSGEVFVVKVEAVVVRERVETVIDAVEEETGHVGVTVVEAIGHGRERGVTHEYRGRTFESRFLPKALLTFLVEDALAERVVAAIADAARSGHSSGDGLCWTSPVANVVHHRTGERLG